MAAAAKFGVDASEYPCEPLYKRDLELKLSLPRAFSRSQIAKLLDDTGIWKEAPILTGSTKFEPLPDVKNIMITGGAGFM